MIYDRQLIIELLEYGYMLHRSLYHQLENLQSSKEIRNVQFQILDLKRRMREASHAGEIRDLLNAGWKEMSLPELRQDIEDGLSMRESDRQADENARLAKTGLSLTIVFGLAAAASLADQIVTPLWRLSRLSMPVTPELEKVISAAFAITFVVLVVVAAVKFKLTRKSF